MPTTYEPIATTTLGSAASSITFSSIPSTYTDLRLVFVGRYNTSTNGEIWLRLNSSTSTIYSTTELNGNGSTAYSSATTNDSKIIISVFAIDSTQPALITSDIFSYAGSTNKTCLNTSSNDKNGSGTIVRQVGLFRSTSAINSVLIIAGASGNFAAGTTATLYGIKSF